MKVLNMCDYCENKIPECEACGVEGAIVFGIDLDVQLDEPKLNDAVVACDKFWDNGERGVLFIKV